MALEEPQAGDESIDLDGISLSLPPDVRMVLQAYAGVMLDHDSRWGGDLGFFVRYDRGSWHC